MFSRDEKILLAILAAVHFSHIVDFMIMMPLGPQMMRIFGIDPHQFGLLVSSYTLSAGVSGLIASIWIDRFDRKKSLLFFCVGFSFGTIACALSRNYEILLLSRSFTGAFGGVMSSVILSIVSDSFHVERRGTAMGFVMGAFSVASVFGVPFSLFLANHFDWHSPFMFLGFTSILIALLVSLKLKPMRDHLKGRHTHENSTFFALQHLMNSPNQLKALLFMFFVIFGQFSVIPFISPSFVLNGKLPESHLPLIYLAGGIVSMFTSPIMGRLTDRFGKKKIFYIGASCSVIPILFITNLGPSITPVMILISSSFFLVMSGRMVPAMAIMSSSATPRYRGSFMSITSSIQQFSSAIASYVAGLVVISGSDGSLLRYNYVGLWAIACTLIALLLVSKVHLVEGDQK